MSIVYISVGMQKTGTTALQSFMRENEKALENQGCCYPLLKLGIASKYNDRNAYFLVYRASEIEEKSDREDEERRVREKAFTDLGDLAKTYPKIILSDELIWHRYLDVKDFWKNAVNDFKKIQCDVKVIVYLRRQDLFIQSLWNQSVKAMPRIEKTFEECIRTNQFKYYPLDYYKNLCKIAEAVGRENIIVRVYEKGQFEGEEHTIYSDFLKSIDVKMTDEFTKENVIPNDSMDGNFIELKRIMNQIPDYKLTNDFMRNPMCEASVFCKDADKLEKMSMFSYTQQLEYLKQFQESNEKVAKEFLNRADGILFYDLVVEQKQWKLEPEKMYRDLLVLMCEEFCEQEKKITELREEMQVLKEEVRKLKNSLFFRGYRKLRRLVIKD